jgi:hypothetical protein
VGAFQDLMVAGVGHVQALGGDDQAGGKAQRRAWLGVGFDGARGARRLEDLLAQCAHRRFQCSHAGRADDAIGQHAVRVDQHHRGPGLDVEALPGMPVPVVRDRQAHPMPAQALERGQRIAVRIEARLGQDPHLQATAVAPFQHGQVGQALHAPGRGRIDEGQRHHAALQ